jgi:hypothetical protein
MNGLASNWNINVIQCFSHSLKTTLEEYVGLVIGTDNRQYTVDKRLVLLDCAAHHNQQHCSPVNGENSEKGLFTVDETQVIS